MNNFFGGKSSSPTDDGPEFPAGDEGLKKPIPADAVTSVPEDLFSDASLDIETPGSPDDWKKSQLPTVAAKSLLQNPGKYSDSDRVATSVIQKLESFTGFKMEYNKQSTNLTVGHSISMGSRAEPANYSFMMQYFDQKNVVLGRLGTEGDFHGVGKRFINNWATVSLVHQRGPKDHPDSILNAELDIKGDDATTSFKLQLHNAAPTVSVSYNQAITPALSLGCEGILMVPGISSVSAGFKYSQGKHVFSGQVVKQPLSPASGHLTYLKKVDSRMGSQINYATQLKISPNPKTGQYGTSWTAGWDYKMQLSSVKGIVDSDGKLYSSIEQRINQFMSLVFSGVADLYNNEYGFGFGLQLQMQDLTEEQQRELERQILAMQGGGPPPALESDGDDEFAIKKKDNNKT
eukprot:CAMPEP_0201507212 /NCGR_PEP_ID=MMETSP0161_2-20130828/944_1 /ASSEMBLY_ACC=CAM_ASM_000251 /TAXON_ID=180227 /ORGANISM="Neoparamoeba aestuarina, Strain SoJaBio B1-5/56/2" /LENGTH=403 /DNA_ID=CAMNT_0047901515 /DNA_START=60 /DNA_END=1267 /DNA_ORIENTATION=-